MLLVNFIVTNSKSLPNQSYDIFVPKLAKNMTPTYKKTIPNPTMVRFGITLNIFSSLDAQIRIRCFSKLKFCVFCKLRFPLKYYKSDNIPFYSYGIHITTLVSSPMKSRNSFSSLRLSARHPRSQSKLQRTPSADFA